MNNKVKDRDIKSQTYYFFKDIITTKNVDQIFIYYIRYVTIKYLKYVKINSANPLYLIFSNMNGYFEEINI